MKSRIGEALRSGLVGGAAGGLISAALNYRLLPLPQTSADNAIGHGMSGFFCGLMSGLVAVLVCTRRKRPESTGS